VLTNVAVLEANGADTGPVVTGSGGGDLRALAATLSGDAPVVVPLSGTAPLLAGAPGPPAWRRRRG